MAEGRKTIVIMLAVLLALVAVGGVIIFLLPAEPSVPTTPDTAVSVPQRLDTTILERTDYTGLDTSLLQQGALPVLPPATVGKANPFL